MIFPNSQATTFNDKVVRQFAIMTVVWGVVGMLVGVIIAAQLDLAGAQLWALPG
jgi:cytochrome c oxidase cbb3-type subunit 1